MQRHLILLFLFVVLFMMLSLASIGSQLNQFGLLSSITVISPSSPSASDNTAVSRISEEQHQPRKRRNSSSPSPTSPQPRPPPRPQRKKPRPITLAPNQVFRTLPRKVDDLYSYCRRPENCYDARCRAEAEPLFDGSTNFTHQEAIAAAAGGCIPNKEFYFEPAVSPSSSSSSPPTTMLQGIDEFECASSTCGNDKNALFDGTLRDRTHEDSQSSPLLDGDADSNNDEQLFEFKRHTAWMFDRWADWGGRCSNDTDGVFRAAHRADNALFEVQNFCLHPMGNLSGFLAPTARGGGGGGGGGKKAQHQQQFRGTDDSFFVTEDVGQDGVAEWVASVEPSLSEPARCYLDTKLVLFPVNHRIGNAGHAAYRAGSMLRFIEAAFGKDARDQREHVTVGYVAHTDVMNVHDGFHKSNVRNHGMRLFYPLLGTSWFSVFTKGWQDHLNASEIERFLRFKPMASSSSSAVAEALQKQRVCFRSAYLWHDAFADAIGAGDIAGRGQDRQQQQQQQQQQRHNNNNGGVGDHHQKRRPLSASSSSLLMQVAANVPGRSTMFHIHGPRSLPRDAETLQLLDTKLRACLRLPPRRKSANLKRPHVILALRSRKRRLSMQPYIITEIGRYVTDVLGGIFETFEHIHMPFAEVVKRYSRADVVIGFYGVGILWSAFAPPNAVVMEINAWWNRYATESGINVSPNSEYGGQAVAARQFHVALADQGHLLRFPTANLGDPTVFDSAVTPAIIKFGLSKVKCLADESAALASVGDEHGISSSGNAMNNVAVPAAVPADCQFHDAGTLQELSKAENVDMDGTFLGRVAVLKQQKQRFSSGDNDSGDGDEEGSGYFSSKLQVMITHRKTVATLLRPLRRRLAAQAVKLVAMRDKKAATAEFEDNPIVALIIQPCALEPHVFAEFSALKIIMQRVDRLVVAEYAAGFDFCRHRAEQEAPRRRRQLQQREEDLPRHLQEQAWQRLNRFEPDLPKLISTCVFPCVRLRSSFDIVLVDGNHTYSNSERRRQELYQQFVHHLYGTMLTLDAVNGQVYANSGTLVKFVPGDT